MTASKLNYERYILELKNYHDTYTQEEILLIQTFACHGVVNGGCQDVLVNKYSSKIKFYELIDVEKKTRNYSKDMIRCYFMTLFACCRESYLPNVREKQLIGSHAAERERCRIMGVEEPSSPFKAQAEVEPTWLDLRRDTEKRTESKLNQSQCCNSSTTYTRADLQTRVGAVKPANFTTLLAVTRPSESWLIPSSSRPSSTTYATCSTPKAALLRSQSAWA